MGCGPSSEKANVASTAPEKRPKPTPKKKIGFKADPNQRPGEADTAARGRTRRRSSARRRSQRSTSNEPMVNRAKLPDDGENLKLEGNWELEGGMDVRDQNELDAGDHAYPPASASKHSAEHSSLDYYDADLRGLTAPKSMSNSYADLAAYLSKDFVLDVHKVRAIMAWMSAQKIRTSQYGADAKEDTPIGYMKGIQNNIGTFAGLFTLLCRSIGIPCVIVKGTYKSSFHDVGEDDLENSKCSWTVVYIDSSWQIVHPYLVCTPLATEPKGGEWRLLEASRTQHDNQELSSLRVFNEFFFLPKPEDFVCLCLPDEEFSQWQLLDDPIDYRTFVQGPFLRPGFFQKKLTLRGHKSCVLNAIGGKCIVQMKGIEENLRGLTMTYELLTRDTELELDDKWGELVLCGRNEDTWNVQIRFPIEGVFKISIFGVVDNWSVWLADFKVICDTPLDNFKAQPSVPGDVGWGPNPLSYTAGLLAPSHDGGIIFVKPKEEHVIKFIVNRKIRTKHEFLQSGTPKEMLAKHVKKTSKNRELDFAVYIPDKGEYTLMLYVQDEKTREFRNVCNYLFTDIDLNQIGKKREGVQQRKARERLRLACTGQDIEELDESIEKFIKEKLEEGDDDFSRAKRRNRYLKLKRGLREGVMRRHEETLAKAVDEAEKSPYREVLRSSIDDAKELLDHLRNLEFHCHDISEMNHRTIAELANYASPLKSIHDTMVVTYLLLGEDYKYLENWSHIQALLHKQGQTSVINRINSFTGDIDGFTLKMAERIHRRVLESEVLSASVCASAFYQWANNVLPELRKGTYRGNASQNAGDSYDSDQDGYVNFSNNASGTTIGSQDIIAHLSDDVTDDDYFSQNDEEMEDVIDIRKNSDGILVTNYSSAV